MFEDSVSDYRSQSLLKKYLRIYEPVSIECILKNLYRCGSGVIPAKSTVEVVRTSYEKNGKPMVSSRFANVIRCNSAWSCPHCTPIIMSKKGREISVAIEALAARGLSAAMFTFTIPHNRRQTADEVYTILRNSWHHFIQSGTKMKQRKVVNEKTGAVYEWKQHYSVFNKFRYEFENVYNVRSYEFTWSAKNGWHPHIHALYWFPDSLFNKITDSESELATKWDKIARHQTEKFYMQQKDWRFNGDPDLVRDFVKLIFANTDNKTSNHVGLHISKNADGTPLKMTSGLYLADSKWNGSAELTAQRYKTAAHNHYTPFQMIDKAKSAESWGDACRWLKLFVEYAKAVWATRRVQWAARTDIKKIIADWIESHENNPTVTTLVKKKDTNHVTTTVYKFTIAEWYIIYDFDLWFPEKEFLIEILKRARLPDATEQIAELIKANFGSTRIRTRKIVA